MKIDYPVKLSSARAWRTYVGGSQIDKIHGIPERGDSQFPEEWIISTVIARNSGREAFSNEGLNFVEGTNISLKSLIKSYPCDLLGNEHYREYGAVPGVLIKIIDAGERLTIQAHPTKQKAMELFGSPFGKTECWHILGGLDVRGEKPCIFMGFKEGISREKWQDIFRRQDIPSMLDCLHRFDVHPGETYLIHGGVPHAIGAGCLLIEIQEPTDYTIRTERVTPAGLTIDEFMLHQGLGFEKMFDVFDYTGIEEKIAKERWCIPPVILQSGSGYQLSQVVGYDNTSCFRLLRCDIKDTFSYSPDGHFCGLYFLKGKGEVISKNAHFKFSGGDQFFVPACAAPFNIIAEPENPATVFFCYGPEI